MHMRQIFSLVYCVEMSVMDQLERSLTLHRPAPEI